MHVIIHLRKFYRPVCFPRNWKLIYQHHHQCSAQEQVLRYKHRNHGCSPAECRSSTAIQEPRLQFYQGLNSCGSFPLLSSPHSFFDIWTDLKNLKVPRGTNVEVWEWIWLTVPSGRDDWDGQDMYHVWSNPEMKFYWENLRERDL